MIFKLLRKDPRRAVIEGLHDEIVAAARQPRLYAELGVPDTLEGRFEALCLHVLLVLRRLRALPAPAAEIGQELVDHVFRQLDRSLREMGVGDFGVPKRMKKLAQAFYGRARAYDGALEAKDREALAAALARNMTGGAEPAMALADYTLNLERALAGMTLDVLTKGPRLASPDWPAQEVR